MSMGRLRVLRWVVVPALVVGFAEFATADLGSSAKEWYALPEGAPPRLHHLRDGRSVHHWDWNDAPPSVDDVAASVTSTASAAG